MSDNPYSTPTADLQLDDHGNPIQSRLWSARGRLSVMTFLAHSLILSIVSSLLMGVSVFSTFYGTETEAALSGAPGFGMFGLVFVVVVSVLSTWIQVVMMIKRFHDRNMVGWWVLTVFIIIGLIFLVLPGKKTPNRFGGFRAPKTWEFVLGVIAILIYVAYFGAMIFGITMGSDISEF